LDNNENLNVENSKHVLISPLLHNKPQNKDMEKAREAAGQRKTHRTPFTNITHKFNNIEKPKFRELDLMG
jgi:hypothetical protein